MQQELLKSLFKNRFGEAVDSSVPLKGDGSERKLFRLANKQRSVIGAVNSDLQENKAFLGFSKHFRAAGLPVPEIYAEDPGGQIYLEEDLGDVTLFDLLSAQRDGGGFSQPVIDMYRQVAAALPRFQVEAGKTLNYKLCYPRASFDKQSMLWDLNYFKYYFLRLSHTPFDEQALENDFKHFADFLLAAERDFFLYRDFQSRNIMIKDGKPYFIDYQGGRKGALQYDIASLLFDAKADIPFDVRDELLRHYLEAVSKVSNIRREEFMKYYPGFVYIRIMQALGAYGLRGFYERKSHFLQSIPYAIRNLEHQLRKTELPVKLPALMQIFKRMVSSSALRQFGQASLKLTVRIESFSYHTGMPADDKGHGGGYVFDCRALPNPGKQAEFAKLTGQDPPVIAYLEKQPALTRFLGHATEMVDAAVENYQKRNFTDLMVAFGCTGGRHRSVYCAEFLAKHLREKYRVAVEVRHREQLKAEESA